MIRLGDVGVHGNGHMMMLEKNSDDIAARDARVAGEGGAGEELAPLSQQLQRASLGVPLLRSHPFQRNGSSRYDPSA